jgi:hypothetical protein
MNKMKNPAGVFRLTYSTRSYGLSPLRSQALLTGYKMRTHSVGLATFSYDVYLSIIHE